MRTLFRLLKILLITLISLAVVGFVAFLVVVNIGWKPLPIETPHQHQAFDPRYEAAAQAALAALISAREDLGTPALTAAVSIDGELIWAGAVGWADVDRGVAADLGTKFRIGSTSKAVTATGLARLIDAGIMALDTPIRAYLPELPNEQWYDLTPRQLASHTAGIPGYNENWDFRGAVQALRLHRQFDDVMDALDVFDDSPLLHEPGTAFHYSSFDVNLLSAAMQGAAGKPFLEVLADEVFAPLGLQNIHADYQDRPVKGRATHYEIRDGAYKPWREVNQSLKWASGGLVATSSDLVSLARAYYDAELIRPKTVAALWTPQVLASGEVNEQGYAIGWRAGNTERLFGEGHPTACAHHGGVSKGAMSWLVLYPELRMATAINMNTWAEEFSTFARKEPAISQAFLAVLQAQQEAEVQRP